MNLHHHAIESSKKKRRALRFIVIVTVSLASQLWGCASADLGDKRAGEACTRRSQCASGFSCVQGVCQTVVTDAGKMASDAGADAGSDDGGK